MAADFKGKLDQEAADERRPPRRDCATSGCARCRYEARLAYLKDAYRQPFRDALMQAGYHPQIRLEYGARDLRGPKAEVGGPDSEAAYQASKIAASNAWRIMTHIIRRRWRRRHRTSASTRRLEGARKTSRRSPKRRPQRETARKKRFRLAREDYMRRTAKPGTGSAVRQAQNATAIEKQAEGWRGGA